MPAPFAPRNIIPAELEKWRKMRWRGRTDLRWLCRDVLGWPDANAPHLQPFFKFFQQFPVPEVTKRLECDVVEPGRPIVYTPAIPLYSLPGKRRRLLIDSRGSMKTSYNIVGGIIQIILNYPDCAIALFRASITGAQDILQSIKSVFQFNPTFRSIYPDYCPQKRIGDFGNRDEFTVPNRVNISRIEPCLRAHSIDQGVAGAHYDWMKFSDIVDEANTKTQGQIASVCAAFFNRENLLVRPEGWMEIEGTRYDFRDLHGKLIERYETDPVFRDNWEVFVRGCYVNDVPNGEHTFQPRIYKVDEVTGKREVESEGELETPYKLDEKGEKISWWPERFPTSWLKLQAKNDPIQFACQRQNRPQAAESDQIPFPLDKMRLKTRAEFARVPCAFHTVTVDTASTANPESNYSCITCCAWDRFGRCYVHDIRHGRMQPIEIINHIFDMMKYRPTTIKIEETAFVEGLKPSINRRCDITGIYPPFEYIKRETTISKQDRILRTLQPWYSRGEIYFVDDIPCLDHLKLELERFSPTGAKYTDDILDTLADQFQNREWFGRERERPEQAEDAKATQRAEALDRMRTAMFEGDVEDPEAVWDLGPTGGSQWVQSRIGGI